VARYAASPIPLGGRLPDPVGVHSSSAHNSIRAADAGRLWWDPVDDRVAVTVADGKSGLQLEVPVRDGQAPLEVFRHPFADAGQGR